MDDSGPIVAEIGRDLAECRPISLDSGPMFAPNLADIGRNSTEFGQKRSNSANTWPSSGPHRPKSCNCGRIRTNSRRNLDINFVVSAKFTTSSPNGWRGGDLGFGVPPQPEGGGGASCFRSDGKEAASTRILEAPCTSAVGPCAVAAVSSAGTQEPAPQSRACRQAWRGSAPPSTCPGPARWKQCRPRLDGPSTFLRRGARLRTRCRNVCCRSPACQRSARSTMWKVMNEL